MSKISQYLIFFAITILSFPTLSAGFNCAKASTAVEKMICTNAPLSDLDGLLAASYKQALANTSSPVDLKTEQKYWLQEIRDACKDTACLTQVYNTRLEQLNSGGLSGEYQRTTEPHTASIMIQPVEYQQFKVSGNALWVGNVETGNVNVGELDSLVELKDKQLHYHSGDNEKACKLTITFAKNALIVSDDNGYCGGHHVTFDGEYQRVGKKTR